MKKSIRSKASLVLAAIAVLSFLTYARSLALPFISDDYVQIHYARQYGVLEHWPALFGDALYRCRATSLILTHWTEQLFGIDPLPYRLTSLFLHIVCSALLFALGSWRAIGWRISALAALVFAVLEGHQEAVIWYAALPELLALIFVLTAALCWIRFQKAHSPWWFAATLGAFVLALLSKESAVFAVPVLLLIQLAHRPSLFFTVTPFAALAVAYFFWGYAAREQHLHYNDGTFSLGAPFLLTLARSLFRMMWIWGLIALLAAWCWRVAKAKQLIAAAAVWMTIALGPNLFLTYMTQVPSRHTYAASCGLAVVIALGLLSIHRRFSMRWLMPAAFAVFALQQAGYIWTKKQRQFEERAAPTVDLLRKLKENDKRLHLRCFPYGAEVAEFAANIEMGRVVTVTGDPVAAVDVTFDFCAVHGAATPGAARASR